MGTDRIIRSDLSSQIAQRLRDDIVHGRIPAHTRLIQDELCERFGTSRMPVRDALQQLTHEGLVELQGQQRVVVPLGADDVEEAYELIALLHAWASRQAALMASDEELQELAALYRAAAGSEDPYEFGELGMLFHRKINLLSHSPRLIRTLTNFQTTVARAMPFTDPRHMEPAKKRYRAILGAISDRDPDRAEQLTREHSMISVALLRDSIERRSGLPAPPSTEG